MEESYQVGFQGPCFSPSSSARWCDLALIDAEVCRYSKTLSIRILCGAIMSIWAGVGSSPQPHRTVEDFLEDESPADFAGMAKAAVKDAVVDCGGAVGGWSGCGRRLRSGGRACFAERPDAFLELALAREFGIGIGGG